MKSYVKHTHDFPLNLLKKKKKSLKPLSIKSKNNFLKKSIKSQNNFKKIDSINWYCWLILSKILLPRNQNIRYRFFFQIAKRFRPQNIFPVKKKITKSKTCTITVLPLFTRNQLLNIIFDFIRIRRMHVYLSILNRFWDFHSTTELE